MVTSANRPAPPASPDPPPEAAPAGIASGIVLACASPTCWRGLALPTSLLKGIGWERPGTGLTVGLSTR